MRKSGDKHRYIFGVTLAQISDIAKKLGKDNDMARKLWSDENCRESQMLAPMIFNADDMNEDEARQWIQSMPNREVADIACHKLLRNLHFAEKLASEYADSENELEIYTALRLYVNLSAIGKIKDWERVRHIIGKYQNTASLSVLTDSLKEDLQ